VKIPIKHHECVPQRFQLQPGQPAPPDHDGQAPAASSDQQPFGHAVSRGLPIQRPRRGRRGRGELRREVGAGERGG